ncbi:MAG: hypothetical protein ACT4PU_00770 [Planctomycetota bacterium]
MTALKRETLAGNTAARSLGKLSFTALETLCRESAAAFLPDAESACDPRGPLPIAYSENRRKRLGIPGCVVCESRTCAAVDWHALPGEDLAWLTPNLYPIVAPRVGSDAMGASASASGGAHGVHGIHLVHWSSLRHDGGLIGAEPATAAALFAQLARAGEWLLHHADAQYPESGEGHRGHVGLVKNRGRTVGGSVEHDHQQLMLSSVPFAEPAATRDLAAALHAAPAALRVDDINGLATTLVPPFMRRPLHAFIVPRRSVTPAGWLHHLDEKVRDAVAFAVARLCQATSTLMANEGREPAWNLICHEGLGCEPIFEMRPFTQPLGGYEHLGLYLCEERPATSAARLRAALPR